MCQDRGANITMCAAIANAGLLLHRCQVGPYNTERLLAFLNDLHQRLVPEQDQEGEHMRTFVITWDQERSQKGDSGCASEKLGVPHLLSD